MTKVVAAVLLLLLTVVMVAVYADFISNLMANIIASIEDIDIINIIRGVLP